MKLKGSVKAPAPALFRVPFFDDITITESDGRFVHFYPYMQLGYHDYDVGQPLQPLDGRPYLRSPESLRQFWSQLAGLDPQNQNSNIKLIAEDVIPDATALARRVTQTIFEQARVTTQQSTFSGQRMVYDIQVRHLVVWHAYKGKSMEEILFASLLSTTVFLPDGSVKAAIWGVANMYGVGGPVDNDYLNDPELATVCRSEKSS